MAPVPQLTMKLRSLTLSSPVLAEFCVALSKADKDKADQTRVKGQLQKMQIINTE